MKFHIKNNNLYYYHIPIFGGQLSYFLFFIYLYIIFVHPNFIKNINYLSIIVAVFGIIDTILHINKYNLYLIFLFIIFFHLIFFYPFINFKKYMKPNMINYFLSFIGILIIKFLPYWPYLISRENGIYLFIAINLFFTSIYYLC
tara:strand:+ start:1213 stop:1644 length:432 start_codon:yes stop_codon:yes gene_type:complete